MAINYLKKSNVTFVTDEPWRLLGRPRDTAQLQIASCYPMREALGLAEGANGALCTVGAARRSCVGVPVGNWPPNAPHRLLLLNRNIRTPFGIPCGPAFNIRRATINKVKDNTTNRRTSF